MLRILLLLKKDDGRLESATCRPQVHHICDRTANAYDEEYADPHRSFKLVGTLQIRA